MLGGDMFQHRASTLETVRLDDNSKNFALDMKQDSDVDLWEDPAPRAGDAIPNKSNNLEPGDPKATEVLLQVLKTPYEDIYQASPDGTTYLSPPALRGTPVTKLKESSDDWERSWMSLDAFLADEEEEHALKTKYQFLKNLDPSNKKISDQAKRHQDNMSKHYKIREIFGSTTTYHPNQLVAKKHMPADGLCAQELMYRLACRVSDLQVLRSKGELSMDPWDFLRWRVSKKISERLHHPGENASGFIKSLVYRMADDTHGKSPDSEDPLLRQAVIRASYYTHRRNSFKTEGKVARKNTNPRAQITHARPRAQSSSSQANRVKKPTAEEREISRREKRPKVANQPTRYQGVTWWMQSKMASGAQDLSLDRDNGNQPGPSRQP